MKKRKYAAIKLKRLKVKKWKYTADVRPKYWKANVNHDYKDTVFTKYFGNKEKAIELYNALYHKELPENTPVQMITLDDTLFVKRKNDVAFIIDGHFLIFVEHQSTINENMPLRLLLYAAQEYEKIFGYRIVNGKRVSNPNLYRTKRIKIPKPEFFVLYNGSENLTERDVDGNIARVSEKILRLSDAFMEDDVSENTLELCVKVIDIRYATGHESLQRQGTFSSLGEYSYFISKVEEYGRYYSRGKAIREAAGHCIEMGVLKEFLLTHETEVVAMLLGVYDEEMEREIEKQVYGEEKFEEGVAMGEARGEARGEVRGEARGEAKKEKVLILNMHKEGCTLELIAKITQKGVEEIKAILAGQDTF